MTATVPDVSSNIMAELIAKRVKGEVTQDEFYAAQKIIQDEFGYIVPETGVRIPPKKEVQRNRKILKISFSLIAFIAFVIWIGGDGTGTEEIQGNKKAAIAQSAEQAVDRQNGFHCLSAWDGSSDALVKYVKARLRDPSSFEHIKTRITPKNADGHYVVIMEYRARNGFGGMNREVAHGKLKGDCSLVAASP